MLRPGAQTPFSRPSPTALIVCNAIERCTVVLEEICENITEGTCRKRYFQNRARIPTKSYFVH